MRPPRKVLLACGGTGGHIFPAFSLAEELKARDPGIDVLYVCGNKDIENAIFKMVAGQRIASVESAPFRGALSLLKPSFLIKLIMGFSQAFKLLRRERPDVVVGFGGHYSFPVVLMARLAGARVLLHEQNVAPGMANRWLVRVVYGVALSFEETKQYLPRHGNVRVTGNPIRVAIEKDCRDEALRFFNFSEDKKTLLVLGGSQGAESINSLFLQCLPHLAESMRKKIQVLHLCGRLETGQAEATLKEWGVTGRAFSFFERMDLAYAVADLALGRAGATFLAEISAKKIPAILMPYPFGDGHQFRNAEVFSRHHESLVMRQGEVTPQALAEALEQRLLKISERAGERHPAQASSGARALLADFVIECASR